MASAHSLIILKDLTISSSATGLFDESGNSLPTANIVGSGNYAYSNTFLMSPKSLDHILTAACEGCTVEILLQMSPDGINWCNCVLGNGSNCEFECTATVGDCTTQVIDVPVLQYVRVKIGNAGSVGGTCNVMINHTLN